MANYDEMISGLVGPTMNNVQALTTLAKTIRSQMGEDDMSGSLSEFKQSTQQSQDRLRAAIAESQKDPRDIIDKLEPGIMGLASIIDMAKGRKNIPERKQKYLELAKERINQKEQRARRKLLDKVAEEEMLGKNRATILGASQTAATQKNASISSALTAAQGLTTKGKDGKTVDPSKMFDLRLKQTATKILERDPSTWGPADLALLKTAFPNFEYMSAEDINQERTKEALKYVNEAVKSYDTSTMTPDEIAGLRSKLYDEYLAAFGGDEPMFDFQQPQSELNEPVPLGEPWSESDISQFYKTGSTPQMGSQNQGDIGALMELIQKMPYQGAPSDRTRR